jgi:asparagine synthase (glutamine-hydrolysing)
MCGISGIIDKGDAPVDAARIRMMTDVAAHRGPDGSGVYHGRNFALGHRRLAILDLSARGKQPMSYLGRYWITYNGEIYNYIEVRDELRRAGARFETGTDTEVILAAYAAWGEDCLRRFNGMWAFALYDSVEDILFLARDRFGVKPLYYADGPGEFAFGSEIKQLLTLQSSVRANQRIVVESLLTRFEGHTDETFFEGVKILSQGHTLRYKLANHSYNIRRWYQLAPQKDVSALSIDDAALHLRATFEDAVRIRLRSDVRVGTCLSGGLDSSATSAFAARLYGAASGTRFTGIHARSTEAASDESRYAVEVARHLNLDLHVVQPSTADFIATIDEVVATQEEPFGSPSMFMGWHVFQKAKALGCKVMLNGQGGDEVLLGYERYYAAFLKSLPLWRFLREFYLQSKRSRMQPVDLLLYLFYFTNADLRIRRLKAQSRLRAEIKNRHDFSHVRRSAESFRKLDELQILEIGTLQLPHLLRYEDRNSMRHSIETRLPFLDYRVVEAGISLRPQIKISDGWTKYVLRKAVDGILPPDVTWRTNKLGFEAPEKTWLTQHQEAMKREVAGSSILREICDRQRVLADFHRFSLKDKWAYFNLAAWERVHQVQWS